MLHHHTGLRLGPAGQSYARNIAPGCNPQRTNRKGGKWSVRATMEVEVAGEPEPMSGSDATVVVRLSIKHRLVGDSPALGSWSPEAAPGLTWTDGDVWCADLALPPGPYEFKAVAYNTGTKRAIWETQPNNRFIEVPSTPGELLVPCTWGSAEVITAFHPDLPTAPAPPVASSGDADPAAVAAAVTRSKTPQLARGLAAAAAVAPLAAAGVITPATVAATPLPVRLPELPAHPPAPTAPTAGAAADGAPKPTTPAPARVALTPLPARVGLTPKGSRGGATPAGARAGAPQDPMK
ncbi:hypothetical protein QJQ45_019407, partial [Haematococcus lacustris]